MTVQVTGYESYFSYLLSMHVCPCHRIQGCDLVTSGHLRRVAFNFRWQVAWLGNLLFEIQFRDENSLTIDQFWYVKIQPQTIDLSTRLWGINTEFVEFIPRSLVVRSIVWDWILVYRNWSIISMSFPFWFLVFAQHFLFFATSAHVSISWATCPLNAMELITHVNWQTHVFFYFLGTNSFYHKHCSVIPFFKQGKWRQKMEKEKQRS